LTAGTISRGTIRTVPVDRGRFGTTGRFPVFISDQNDLPLGTILLRGPPKRPKATAALKFAERPVELASVHAHGLHEIGLAAVEGAPRGLEVVDDPLALLLGDRAHHRDAEARLRVVLLKRHVLFAGVGA